MTDFYSPAQRQLQRAFQTEPLADLLTTVIMTDHIPDDHASFITSRNHFFLSTVNPVGEPTVSYKGGATGFVQILDAKTLIFPSYNGNGMFLSMGNIASNAKIGMLFIDFESPHRVRVQATATLLDTENDLAPFPGADLIVRASVDAVFVNCGRYIHPHEQSGQSVDIPDQRGEQPLAEWKRLEGIQDVLSPKDRELARAAGDPLAPEEYNRRVTEGS